MVRNRVDYVSLDEADGRIAATLWLVYPPGIATRGEPLPGFENEVQGLYREKAEDGSLRFFTYVVREA
jgi:arginine/lysine/ornithine decarboxylase